MISSDAQSNTGQISSISKQKFVHQETVNEEQCKKMCPYQVVRLERTSLITSSVCLIIIIARIINTTEIKSRHCEQKLEH